MNFILSTIVTKAYAADAPALSPSGDAASMTTNENLKEVFTIFFGNIMMYLLLIAGFVVVIYIVWAGIQYITSNGNADKAKVAKQNIINALIGVVVILVVYSLIRFGVVIANTIGGFFTVQS